MASRRFTGKTNEFRGKLYEIILRVQMNMYVRPRRGSWRIFTFSEQTEKLKIYIFITTRCERRSFGVRTLFYILFRRIRVNGRGGGVQTRCCSQTIDFRCLCTQRVIIVSHAVLRTDN